MEKIVSSLGRIVYDGRLTADIYSVTTAHKAIILKAVAYRPLLKDIPVKDTEVPFVIYCADGSILATGVQLGSIFKDARKIRGGDLWVVQDLQIIGGLDCSGR